MWMLYLHMPRKALLIYGLLAGLVIFVLNLGKYSLMIGSIKLEIYLAIAGLTFLSLGIFLGIQFIQKKSLKETDKSIPPIGNHWELSNREMEVLQAMAAGLTNQEIADKLFVSLPTIKTHSSNIYQKMEVNRRTQAIQKAIQAGLLDPHTKE